MIVEYPSYGLYKSNNPTEHKINEDAVLMHDFCVNTLNYAPSKIIVVGRSLGSGPAVHLASVRQCMMLVLISPYTSIRSVAKDMVPVFGYLVKERFRNKKTIQKVTAPVFILHGMKV